MTDSFDILGLGAVAIDELLYIDGYPEADAKVRVQRRERQCGGLTATALVAAARLGASCVYAGTLGVGELSHFPGKQGGGAAAAPPNDKKRSNQFFNSGRVSEFTRTN